MRITFFANGLTMAFENGEQVSIAQRPWILVFVEYLVQHNIDPTQQEFVMPDGSRLKILKAELDGEIVYNFETFVDQLSNRHRQAGDEDEDDGSPQETDNSRTPETTRMSRTMVHRVQTTPPEKLWHV